MKTKLLLVAGLLTALVLAAPLNAAGKKADETVLSAYEPVATALANDDLAGAKTAASRLAAVAVSAGQTDLADEAGALAKAGSLKQARVCFKAMAAPVEKMAKGKTGWYVMTCPMANAQWVQSSKEVANPYLGKDMRDCGSIVDGSPAE